jgi:EAL domain-containing protein (putative c-di-GMP-specific phosphodiesterase class I)/FixJ family two-component response regulator
LLVLDDESDMGRLLGRIGAAAGFVIDITSDAPAFQTAYVSATPDVILLDLRLGDTDGIEQVRYLAAQAYPNTLILISGFDSRVLATARDVAAGLGLKVAAAYAKPINVSQLEETLVQLRNYSSSLPVKQLLQRLHDGEMLLEYQPIVCARTRSLGKLEALIRWQHPEHGRLGPSNFLSLLTDHPETAHALADWVLETAARDYHRLKRFGITVPIAVNISPECLTDRSFPDRFEHLLGDMPPRQLCLEVMETAAFRDVGQSGDVLTQLRLKGVDLAIDDFGTGYSSLKLLRQMPFSTLKIDRSFVADMLSSRDSHVIVKAIVDLARTMEMTVIAEGVESEAIAARLTQLGVDFMQGYHTGRAMPVDQLPIWLAAGYRSGTGIVSPAGMLPQAHDDHFEHDDMWQTSVTRAAVPVVPAAPQPGGGLARLTPRQQTVMTLVAAGYSVKQMARQLDLGVGTVKAHLSQAYLILGARNRIDALRRVGLMPGSHAASDAEDGAPLTQETSISNHA